MKFCPTCGQQLADDAAFCANCGENLSQPVAPQAVNQPPIYDAPPVQPVYPEAQPATADEDPYPINVTHKGFWALGFFLEFVGLIMYIVFKDSKPRLAKSALKGFITGLIVWGSIGVIIGLIGTLPMIFEMIGDIL